MLKGRYGNLQYLYAYKASYEICVSELKPLRVQKWKSQSGIAL